MADPEEPRPGDRRPTTPCGDSPGEEEGRCRASPESCKHSRHAGLVNQDRRTVPSPGRAIFCRAESLLASPLSMVAPRHTRVADRQRNTAQLGAPALAGGGAEVAPERRQRLGQCRTWRTLPEWMQHRLKVALEDGSLAHCPEVPRPDAQRCRIRAAVEERVDRPLGGAPDAPDAPSGRDAVKFGRALVCGENRDVEKI